MRFLLNFNAGEDEKRFSIFKEKVRIFLNNLETSIYDDEIDSDDVFINTYQLHMTQGEIDGSSKIEFVAENEKFMKLFKKYEELKKIEKLENLMETWEDIDELIMKYENIDVAWENYKMDNSLTYSTSDEENRDLEHFKHVIKKILKKLKKVVKKIFKKEDDYDRQLPMVD